MMTGSTPIYATIMLLAGVGIPVMAAMNGTLGGRIGNPAAATMMMFALAFIIAAAIAFAVGMPATNQWKSAPAPYYLGGLFVAFYALSITWIGPRFGLGNAVFFVLLGQIATAATIDHFGLFGVAKSEIGLVRFIGILLMAVGVFLARKPMAG